MKKLLLVISMSIGAFTDTKASTHVDTVLSSSRPEGSRFIVERIQSMRFDRSQVKRIYLAPGLGSIVLFPCALVEVFIGRNEDLKAQISPNDKKTLFLNLKLNTSMPTNLIAKCEFERSVFVFDVIPSKDKHQDVVEIRNVFGRPNYIDRKSEIASPAVKSTGRYVLKSPVLISKGGSQ